MYLFLSVVFNDEASLGLNCDWNKINCTGLMRVGPVKMDESETKWNRMQWKEIERNGRKRIEKNGTGFLSEIVLFET